MEEVRDVDEWLRSNDIQVRWAHTISSQIQKQYPELGRAVKKHSNRAELELVQLVDHILKGRFPVRGQKD